VGAGAGAIGMSQRSRVGAAGGVMLREEEAKYLGKGGDHLRLAVAARGRMSETVRGGSPPPP
jgi:hypothetical protein